VADIFIVELLSELLFPAAAKNVPYFDRRYYILLLQMSFK